MWARLAPVVLIACSDPPARVSLSPILGDCGRPVGAQSLKITAFGDSGETVRAVSIGDAVEIGDFPADTIQLGVEVLVESGAVGAQGKTAPLDFTNLTDGGAIPIAMAPPDGFCPTGAMAEARAQPLVARAGEFVLVVGGTGASGPIGTAELYDPATATFAPIALPSALQGTSLLGASLAEMPDGKVMLTLLNALTEFDPVTRSFGPPFFTRPRAFHGSYGIDATHVLVSGGCVDPANCATTLLHSSLSFDLMGNQGGGPSLVGTHQGATVFDLGPRADGLEQLAIAGGASTPSVELFAPTDDTAVALDGLGAFATPIDGGALLALGGGKAAIATPRGTVSKLLDTTTADAPLVLLEDGSVAAIGSEVARYVPTTDRWADLGPGPFASPSLIRLADGSVLVVGGATPSAQAFVFRPSLEGATSGAITAVPNQNGGILTVPEPATKSGNFVLTASDDQPARALVGGPRPIRGSVKATVHDVAGGIALIAQQHGTRAVIAELREGMPATLRGADGMTLCTGQVVTLPTTGVSASLVINSAGTTVTLGDLTVLSCTASPGDAGLWGAGAIGAGGRVTVDAVTVER